MPKAIDHFAVHLWGREFTVVTDHKALKYLDSSKHLNGRLTRWALQLQQHFFKTRYHPGTKHGNADGLSRQAWRDIGEKEDEEHLTRTSVSEGGGVVRHLPDRQPAGCP